MSFEKHGAVSVAICSLADNNSTIDMSDVGMVGCINTSKCLHDSIIITIGKASIDV